MQVSPWVSSFFKDTPLFSHLDPYLSWIDLIHLLCTCKELYHDWISADWKRWRHLASLKKLCCAVGFQQSYMGSPLKQIRLWALDALISKQDKFYSVKRCMGGCGHVKRPCNVTCLKYCICVECAKNSHTRGHVVIWANLDLYKLTVTPYSYAKYLKDSLLTPEESKKHEMYFQSRISHGLSKLAPSTEWQFDGVYSKADIEEIVNGILATIKR